MYNLQILHQGGILVFQTFFVQTFLVFLMTRLHLWYMCKLSRCKFCVPTDVPFLNIKLMYLFCGLQTWMNLCPNTLLIYLSETQCPYSVKKSIKMMRRTRTILR